MNVPMAVCGRWVLNSQRKPSATAWSKRRYGAFFMVSMPASPHRLSEAVRRTLDHLLTVAPGETQSMFDKLKTEPAAPGVKPLQDVCITLQTLRAIGLPTDALADIPVKVLQTLTRRGLNEDASKMRAHPAPIRYALHGLLSPCPYHGGDR